MAARIWLPVMLLALALTGCNPAAKVIGKWEVDMDRRRPRSIRAIRSRRWRPG